MQINKQWLWVILFSFLGAWAFGQNSAETLFEKKRFAEAIPLFEKELSSKEPHKKWRATFRIIESEALSFRYDHALERMEKVLLPSEPLWRARYWLLRTELIRLYLAQYNSFLTSQTVVGNGPVGRSKQDWNFQLEKNYRELWKMRETLVRIPISEDEFLFTKTAKDTERYPTLFDYFLLRWASFLVGRSSPSSPKESAPEYWGLHFSYSLEPSAGGVRQLASLYEEAARLEGAKRDTAKEVWSLERFFLPLRFENHFHPVSNGILRAREYRTRLEGKVTTLKTAGALSIAKVELARAYEANELYEKAVEVCRQVESKWLDTEAAAQCHELRAGIQLPKLDIKVGFLSPEVKGSIDLKVRNLPKVFFRIYPVAEEKLQQWAREAYGEISDYDYLRRLSDFGASTLLKEQPFRQWELAVQSSSPHQWKTISAPIEKLAKGFYVIFAAPSADFVVGKEMVSKAILNVTEHYLFTSSGFGQMPVYRDPSEWVGQNAPTFHLRLLNAGSGRKVAGARLDGLLRQDWGKAQSIKGETDSQGKFKVALKVPKAQVSAVLDACATSNGAKTLVGQATNFYFNLPSKYEIFLDTDRNIFRPGQKVSWRVTVLQRGSQGVWVPQEKFKVHVEVSDPSGNLVEQHSPELSSNGSASGQTPIPLQRMLGQYSIRAFFKENGQEYSGSLGFSVEEYKRPEFEVVFDEKSAAWELGRKAKVRGGARYYSGNPVAQASVEYQIIKAPLWPWGFGVSSRYWSAQFGQKELVALGKLTANAKGEFEFEFTPKLEGEEAAVRYEIEVYARDLSGRSVQSTKSVRVSRQSTFLEVRLSKDFFSSREKGQVSVIAKDLNENPLFLDGALALERFRALKGDSHASACRFMMELKGERIKELESLPWESCYEKAEVESTLFTNKFRTGQNNWVPFPELEEGVYRFTATVSDKNGQKASVHRVFIVAPEAGKGMTGFIPAVAILESTGVSVGEALRVLVGGSEIKGSVFVELWAGQQLIEEREIEGSGIRTVSFPVREAMRGGGTVRWYAAFGYKMFSAQTTYDLSWENKKLKFSLNASKRWEPGQAATLDFEANTLSAQSANGEMLVSVYDRSLDYLGVGSDFWVKNLYTRGADPSPIVMGMSGAIVNHFPVQHRWLLEKYVGEFKSKTVRLDPPSLNIQRSRLHNYGTRAAMIAGAQPEMDGAKLAAPAEAVSKTGNLQTTFEKEAKPTRGSLNFRSDFAETALFLPQLKLEQGKAAAKFVLPERVTSWRVRGFALTPAGEWGALSDEITTQKDLVVRLEIPRFFREGDQTQIKAVLSNQTANKVKVNVEFQILSEQGESRESDFDMKERKQLSEVVPQGQSFVKTPVRIPYGVQTVKIRALAFSGSYQDGEEKQIAVLPARQRLVSGEVHWLTSSEPVHFTLSKENKSVHWEQAEVRVEPHFALSLLNSIPKLVMNPLETVDAIVSRYVPLALMDKLFLTHQGLKAAVEKISRRSTLIPAWGKEDSRRLLQLIETPWLAVSQGGNNEPSALNFLDPKGVSDQKTRMFEKLSALQLPDGGFAWLNGGKADLYLTLWVLGQLAELKAYDVPLDVELLNRALRFVLAELPSHLKPEQSHVALTLFAAYVMSSVGPGNHSDWRNVCEEWVNFADKHSAAMTAFGKAQAALTYFRLGNKGKAQDYLKAALSGAHHDKEVGVYWAPEARSWIWFNDTVEKHAFFLKTLNELQPDHPYLSGIAQWLLMQRKGNEWKSVKASVAAVSSLLDWMKKEGSLSEGSSYLLKWKDEQKTVSVGPNDWLSVPLSWKRTEKIQEGFPLQLEKKGPGSAVASLTTVVTKDVDPVAFSSQGNMLLVDREYFKVQRHKSGGKLHRLKGLGAVLVGDEVEVHLRIKAKTPLEYIYLKEPRPAGFETTERISSWRWDKLIRYEEIRDSINQYFIPWIPAGEYVLSYRMRATTEGKYHVGSSQIQSLYSPDLSGFSQPFQLQVGSSSW